jgi:tetratricopeptide (TPR) repeat protein
MAYFEASLVVEHLVDVNGEQGLRTLLLAYADGATDEQAFSRAFGTSIDAVATSFDKFIAQRYSALREAMKVPPAAPADNVAALRARAAASPGNYVSQISLGAALLRSGDLEGAKAPLRRAAELAPDASGDGSPQALLAQIATKEKDLPAARRAYRQLLAADHANVNAARRLLQVSADSPEDEDYALRLIADLDPFDADVHSRLGKRLFAKNEFAAALTEYRASLALGPANLAEAHADIAEVLLKLGRKDEAKKSALDALKEAPTFARAQDLLLEAIGK